MLVHPGQAWDDATRVQRLAREGWLGFEHDSFALFSFTGKLWAGLGPALVVAVLGLAARAPPAHTRRPDPGRRSCCVYLVDLLTIRAHFDRYVLPLVPPLAVLAGRQRLLAPLTLALLVVPLVWAIGDDARLTRTDTRVVAHGWIVAHIPPGSAVAAESSAPPLAGYRIVGLALPGPGRPFDPDRDVARLRAEGVRYVVVTGADRRPRARRPRPLPARGRLLRRSAGPGTTGSTMSARARADRALGLASTDCEEDGPARSRCSRSRSPAAAARPVRSAGRRHDEPPGRRAARVPAGLAGDLAEARRPDRRARLLPELAAGSADRRDRRPLEQHRLGRRPDRSYLIGFVWQELGQELHINLRGYPGVTKVPTCRSVELVGGKSHATKVPCFADPHGPKTIAGFRVTEYTVNQDADQWHVLYAWRYRGSLYTLSQHVAPPLTFPKVVRDLNRSCASLVLVQPAS